MADATTSSTPTNPRAVLENVDKIPSRTENSGMLYIQRGMSQLSTSTANNNKPSYSTTTSNGGSTTEPAAVSNNIRSNGTSTSENPYNMNMNNDVIDSALLAAMRDPRERVALLRLEQVMIDFINSSDGYMEVGGPYNSLVVSPNKMNIINSNSGGGGNISINNSKSGMELPVPMSSSSMVSLSAYGYRPATSFQRCLLHRLADRFGILRETGSLMEGAIRLVKQKESKIPRQLLLNLPQPNSSFSEGGDSGTYQGMATSGVGVGMGNVTPGMPIDPRDPRAMYSNSSNVQQSHGVMSAPNSGNHGVPGGPATGGKSNSKRKMKIMKRMSSGGDSGKSLGSASSGTGKSTPRSRKNKNFSEKEKAYAEARARIFNSENPAIPAPSLVDGAGLTPSSVISASSAIVTDPSSIVPSSVSQSTIITPPPAAPAQDYVPITKGPSSSSLSPNEEEDGSNVPAASTGMGVAPTKATWRNRRQEENDPDFQRGTLLTQPLASTATAATPVHPQSYNYYAQGGYPSAQQTSYAAGTSDDTPCYYPYSSKVAGRSTGAGIGAGRGGRGYATIQPSPRSPATFTNQYRYPKTNSHHYHHHHHNTHQEPTNLNCMEEFPALP